MSKQKVNEEASAKKIDKIKGQQEKTIKDRDLKILRQHIDQEVDYTLDGSVKQLFLALTKMQVPFNYESTLEEFFPEGMKTDAHGNYYIKIGETKSMFCGHLDTYCYEYKRVWHVINGDDIKTDGTTTLGGDDKAGIVIMIKMIEAGVPGLYYFFRGEEGVTSPTGTWGSKQALKSYKENFKNYDRCIAFDRKGDDSIITQQMYSECCSNEFTDALIGDLKGHGLYYVDDPTGMWCDSGVFMDIIPECTNISVGYVDEHTFRETQDIVHLEKLVDACVNIDWETLPTKRDPSVVSYGVGNYHYDNTFEWDYQYGSESKKKKYEGTRDFVTMDDMFWHVVDILEDIGYSSLNNDFEESEEMYFQNYKTSDFFGLRIIDFEIFMSTDDTLRNYEHVGDIDTFEKYVLLGQDDNIDNDLDDQANRHLNSISKEIETSRSETEHPDEYLKEQHESFIKFIKDNKEYIKTVMAEIQESNKLEISNESWLEMEQAMLASTIKVDYGKHGVNPDDFIEWMAQNWDICVKLTNEKNNGKSNKKKNPEVTSLSETDSIYFDIALNIHRNEIKQFLQQAIEKGHVDVAEQYDHYKPVIDGWIKDKYSKELNNKNKNINHKTFIDWIKSHQRDLSEYYKD